MTRIGQINTDKDGTNNKEDFKRKIYIIDLMKINQSKSV